jgi:hypothetical protein
LQRGIELPHPRDPADTRIDAIVDALLRFDPALAVAERDEGESADHA